MTEDEQDKLFSRFSQATPRTHVKYGGSGLGLFISKSLATLQGGAIGAFSKSDIGSTFGFYVAARMAEGPLTTLRGSNRPLPYRVLSSERLMKAVKLHVLIVEDNLVNQKVLMKQLQRLGWTVSVAGNGVEALEWLKGSVYWRGDEAELGAGRREHGGEHGRHANVKQNIDIILMDVEMPQMSVNALCLSSAHYHPLTHTQGRHHLCTYHSPVRRAGSSRTSLGNSTRRRRRVPRLARRRPRLRRR